MTSPSKALPGAAWGPWHVPRSWSAFFSPSETCNRNTVLRNWRYAMPVSTHGISTCCSRFPSPRTSGPWWVPTRTKEDGGVSARLDGYNRGSLPHVCSLPWLWLKAKPWTLIQPRGAGCNWGLRVSETGRDTPAQPASDRAVDGCRPLFR